MDRDLDAPTVHSFTGILQDKSGRNVRPGLKTEASCPEIEQHFEEGHRVQIRSGVLRGVRGTILRRSALGRVVLRVDCFEDGVCVQVTENLIEPTP